MPLTAEQVKEEMQRAVDSLRVDVNSYREQDKDSRHHSNKAFNSAIQACTVKTLELERYIQECRTECKDSSARQQTAFDRLMLALSGDETLGHIGLLGQMRNSSTTVERRLADIDFAIDGARRAQEESRTHRAQLSDLPTRVGTLERIEHDRTVERKTMLRTLTIVGSVAACVGGILGSAISFVLEISGVFAK